MKDKPYHGGNIWKGARQFAVNPDDIIDFSANINPLGPSQRALDAIKNNLQLVRHYPEPDAMELKGELARFLNIPKQNLLLGNGAAELIYMLGKVYDTRRVLLVSPCFSEYGEGSLRSEFEFIDLDPGNGFKIKPDYFVKEIRSNDIIYIGNPNNPTGSITTKEDLLEIYELSSKRGAVLIIDEAFMDFVYDQDDITLRYHAIDKPDLIVLGSLTKFFAIPGLRLGYLVSAGENIQFFEKLLPTWRINTFAQLAGIESLRDKEYIEKTKQHNRKEREFLFKSLKELTGVNVFQSHANFLLVHCLKSGKSVYGLQDFLGPRGILIRRCDSYRNLDKYYFRVAVRTRSENQKLVGYLRDFFSGSGEI